MILLRFGIIAAGRVDNPDDRQQYVLIAETAQNAEL